MVTVQSIIDYVQSLSGHPLNGDEGVHLGDAATQVGRVTVCWMATADAIEQATKAGGGLVLAHESLYFPYGSLPERGKTAPWESWLTNVHRRQLLEKNGMTLLRVHGSLDEICIFDDFARLLGLGDPVEADKLVKVYHIEPRPLRELVAQVKERTGMKAVRVSAPRGLDQVARRIGLPWGGVGLFVNVGYQEQLIERACDTFIAGESDNYGARFCAELGIPLIETDHEVSENPGLRRFTSMLAKQFPDVEVSFYECPRVWQVV